MALNKIFVSRPSVEANHQTGSYDPVFTIREPDGTEHHTNSIIILGPSEIRYDATGAEGSRIWIETYDRVIMKNGSNLEGVGHSSFGREFPVFRKEVNLMNRNPGRIIQGYIQKFSWWVMTEAIRYWVNHHMDQFELFKFRQKAGNSTYVTISYHSDHPDAFEDLDDPSGLKLTNDEESV